MAKKSRLIKGRGGADGTGCGKYAALKQRGKINIHMIYHYSGRRESEEAKALFNASTLLLASRRKSFRGKFFFILHTRKRSRKREMEKRGEMTAKKSEGINH
jgi:hypothetical protein